VQETLDSYKAENDPEIGEEFNIIEGFDDGDFEEALKLCALNDD
jgi:hypothetical protein